MLPVGTLGLDSATSISPQEAHNAGSRYQMRYSAGVGNSHEASQWKLTKDGEIARIKAAGEQFLANSEWYETRCLEGAGAGHADGASDLIFWQHRGLPRGESIYISWDAGVDQAHFLGLKAYVEAYNQALGGHYHADGLYAGIPALIWMSQHSITRHGWIPSAAAWSTSNVDIPDNYAPPAKKAWDLWFPTKDQILPAIKWLNNRLSGHKLVSCAWQAGGQIFKGAADVNYINIPGPMSSVVSPPPHPSVPPTHFPPHLRRPWPHYMGPDGFFGLQSEGKHSHWGMFAATRADVMAIQHRLQTLGFAPTTPGWADGKYEQPTKAAVTQFQIRHMHRNPHAGHVYRDTWNALFTY